MVLKWHCWNGERGCLSETPIEKWPIWREEAEAIIWKLKTMEKENRTIENTMRETRRPRNDLNVRNEEINVFIRKYIEEMKENENIWNEEEMKINNVRGKKWRWEKKIWRENPREARRRLERKMREKRREEMMREMIETVKKKSSMRNEISINKSPLIQWREEALTEAEEMKANMKP